MEIVLPKNCFKNRLSSEFSKNLKNLETWKYCCKYLTTWPLWFYHTLMYPECVDRMANSVDPDQTAPSWVVWSESILFAKTCLSKYLELQ